MIDLGLKQIFNFFFRKMKWYIQNLKRFQKIFAPLGPLYNYKDKTLLKSLTVKASRGRKSLSSSANFTRVDLSAYKDFFEKRAASIEIMSPRQSNLLEQRDLDPPKQLLKW